MRSAAKHPKALRTITQLDLAELAELRRRKQVIDEALREKRTVIKMAIENGATVEYGARSVRTVRSMVIG